MARRRIWRSLAGLAMVVTLAASSCSDDSARVTDADVYFQIIHALTKRSTTDPEPLRVFVESLDTDNPISLDTEVAVIGDSRDVAEVTFVDDRSEAFNDPDQAAEIVGDGVFIVLGPVVAQQGSYRVEVGQIGPGGELIMRTVSVRRGANGTWTVDNLG